MRYQSHGQDMQPKRFDSKKPRPAISPRDAERSTPTDWSRVAQWYDDLVGKEGSEYHQKVVHPGVLKLLGDVKDKRALDVACGQGVLCRLLQAQGAKTFGIDAARPLLDAAREHGPAEIRYKLLDALDLDQLEIDARRPDPFDAITCVLAIQNIQPIKPVFAGASQLLAPTGLFVIVMMHPCFRNPGETHWVWDEEKSVQYRRVDRYLIPRKQPIITNPGKRDGNYTWSFHRPIGDYVKAARDAGLLLDALEEWPSHKQSQPGARSAAENSSRSEIPMFMAMRFRVAK
ncbi:MAG TPA: class I SAM-dependent methyltransferase [Tepidisphaeraceae bacterium]|nr:class I SAM-dependent methyltransferase [Tepidisphaeraceae bacterium]